MPSLPVHLAIGRASVVGPATGGYCALPYGPITSTAGGGALVRMAIKLPFDFRLERVSWNNRTAAGAGSIMRVFSGATLGTMTTNLLAVASVDLTAAGLSGYCLPSGETSVPTTDTLSTVAGVRDLARDTFINIETTAVTTDIIDLSVVVFGVIVGHCNEFSESD